MAREPSSLDTTVGSEPTADVVGSRAFHVGAKLGGYTLVRELGHGGMGRVWEATHDQLGKRVAIKTLLSELAEDSDVVARFVREGRACVKLRHPNAVDVSDVGFEGGVPYLVMDYLEGETLTSYLASGKLSDAKTIANVVVPILCALQAAHDEGIVHRDVKPGNVFLTRARDGEIIPTLLDFGISKVSGDDGFAVRSGSLMATPIYMSPEQARDSAQVDSRTDLYSLGVLMYQALAGRKPFEAASLHELAHAICTAHYTDLGLIRSDLPEELIGIVRKAMAIDVRDRYQTAGAMARDLIQFAGTRTRVLHAMELGLGGATRAVENPSAAPVADIPTMPLEDLKGAPPIVTSTPAHVPAALSEMATPNQATAPLASPTRAAGSSSVRVVWIVAVVVLLVATWFGSRALMTPATPATPPTSTPAPPNAGGLVPRVAAPIPAPLEGPATTPPAAAKIPPESSESVPNSSRRGRSPRRPSGDSERRPSNIFDVE